MGNLKSDLLEDVGAIHEISWDGSLVKSEFDIVITKIYIIKREEVKYGE